MFGPVPLLSLALLTSGTGAGGSSPSIPVITVATPLTCSVALFPTTSAPIDASGGGGIPSLIARIATDHILRITNILAELGGAVTVPSAIRYAISDGTGVLVSSALSAPFTTGEWRIALSKSLFTLTRGPMTLVLTLVAPSDSTETALQFTIAQGVRQ